VFVARNQHKVAVDI